MFDLLKNDDGKVINVNDMESLIGKVKLIDIRETYEYNSGNIAGAKNIPMGELLMEPDKYLVKDEKYYIMCQSGGRSGSACKELSKQGFDVVNVSGGMGSYVGRNINYGL